MECVPPLIEAARPPFALEAPVRHLALTLVQNLRAGTPERWSHEAQAIRFALSAQGGADLVGVAATLLRTPDRDNRDRIIREKIRGFEARAADSIGAQATKRGLSLAGRLLAQRPGGGLSAIMARLAVRGSEPLVRSAVDFAARSLVGKFVAGRDIDASIEGTRALARRGFRLSFDMVGPPALTAGDADRQMSLLRQAIRAVGAASSGTGLHARGAVSVRLSSLHPRFSANQAGRVMEELLPRLRELAATAARENIGFSFDAEEADKLELTLDLLEALAGDPLLEGWNGLGFTIQAYQRCATAVTQHAIAIAARYRRRLMLRLVKGAGWGGEIRKAQMAGVADYPVFTRKAYADISYISCARLLLGARAEIFPQFATHNVQTLSMVHNLAGPSVREDDWEFIGYRGIGERLFNQVAASVTGRAFRISTLVGSPQEALTHRAAEIGASLIAAHRLTDKAVPPAALADHPGREAAQFGGQPHSLLTSPSALFGPERVGARGLDLGDAGARADLAAAFAASRAETFEVGPAGGTPRVIRNPADRRDVVGTVREADASMVAEAMIRADAAAEAWMREPAYARAATLDFAADLFETARDGLLPLLVREGGKTLAEAMAELRRAVDHLRYQAASARQKLANAPHRALGAVACICPWAMPLGAFTAQLAAALAAGNAVVAKPASQAPLVAGEAVRLLHEAGVPPDVLQLLPGDGHRLNAALAADPRCRGVLFIGSPQAARAIEAVLAKRGDVPLLALTSGTTAMIVDSTAPAERVVADAMEAAFGVAGQRGSALRLLCVQKEVAPRILAMLEDAMSELTIGDPALLETDIGPVMDIAAEVTFRAHVGSSRIRAELPLGGNCLHGSFVAPVLLQIGSLRGIAAAPGGPALHVLTYERDQLSAVLDELAAEGGGLSLAVYSAVAETVELVANRSRAASIFINRGLTGLSVGMHPLGGEGLGGMAPKPAGPLYLHRLLREGPEPRLHGSRDEACFAEFDRYAAWAAAGALGLLRTGDRLVIAARLQEFRQASPLALTMALPAPLGEANSLRFRGRGKVLNLAATVPGLILGLGAALATGNSAIAQESPEAERINALLPDGIRMELFPDWSLAPCDAALVAPPHDAGQVRRVFAGQGALVPVVTDLSVRGLLRLVVERSLSVNQMADGVLAPAMTI